MIQRIQTIYMAIGVIWAIAIILIDPVLFSFTGSDQVFQLTNVGLYSLAGGEAMLTSIPLMVLLALCAIIPLFAILKFKERKLQMKLMRATMLLQLAYIAVAVFYVDRSQVLIGEELDIAPSIWVYTVLLSIICSFLAGKAIKKDEDMVRAADRLR